MARMDAWSPAHDGARVRIGFTIGIIGDDGGESHGTHFLMGKYGNKAAALPRFVIVDRRQAWPKPGKQLPQALALVSVPFAGSVGVLRENQQIIPCPAWPPRTCRKVLIRFRGLFRKTGMLSRQPMAHTEMGPSILAIGIFKHSGSHRWRLMVYL